MVSSEGKIMVFLKNSSSTKDSKSQSRVRSIRCLETKLPGICIHSIWHLRCFLFSIFIVLHTKNPPHDVNALWCVRLRSHDAKSMLNVATFLKTAVYESKSRISSVLFTCERFLRVR